MQSTQSKGLSSFIQTVGIVSAVAAVGKLFGFVREAIVAAYLGTSQSADVFFVASVIPNLMFTALGTAIAAAIVPIYVEEKEKSPEQAAQIMGVLGGLLFLLSIFLTAVGLLFASGLVRFVAPGFQGAQKALATQLTRIMLPSFCFFTLAAFATGILHSHKRFVPPSFTGIAQNAVTILAAVLLARRFGVYGFAIGSLLGAAALFLVQYPAMAQYQIRFTFRFRGHLERIKQMLLLFYPIVIASLAVLVNTTTERIVASRLTEGSVSALNYASKLMYLPLSILLTPLITVLYPNLVEAAIARGERFVDMTFRGAKLLLYVSLPFVVVMLVCARNLIEMAFQRGAFDAAATTHTVQAFVFYSFGFVAIALREYLMNCFYALKNTRSAMWSCIVTAVVYVPLSFSLASMLGVGGIALASTLAMLFQTVYLFIVLWRRTSPEPGQGERFLSDLGRMGLLFLLVYGAALPAARLTEHVASLFRVAGVSAVVFPVFALLSYLLKVQELTALIRLVKR